MPVFQVLRCYAESCQAFQVQQQKKAKKWSCLMCGAKQSLLRVYHESTAASECRQVVQQMNATRGEREELKNAIIADSYYNNDNEEQSYEGNYLDNEFHSRQQEYSSGPADKAEQSKWSEFVDDGNCDDDGFVDENETEGNLTFHAPSSKHGRGGRGRGRGKSGSTRGAPSNHGQSRQGSKKRGFMDHGDDVFGGGGGDEETMQTFDRSRGGFSFSGKMSSNQPVKTPKLSNQSRFDPDDDGGNFSSHAKPHSANTQTYSKSSTEIRREPTSSFPRQPQPQARQLLNEGHYHSAPTMHVSSQRFAKTPSANNSGFTNAMPKEAIPKPTSKPVNSTSKWAEFVSEDESD
ncbi:hypothetical protein HDU76_012355 [Blyttiomyces sp. JEL0837]|nr:hypothetical protein HDU76_012355 [Blyttiomyces sp. JEL0837]